MMDEEVFNGDMEDGVVSRECIFPPPRLSQYRGTWRPRRSPDAAPIDPASCPGSDDDPNDLMEGVNSKLERLSLNFTELTF